MKAAEKRKRIRELEKEYKELNEAIFLEEQNKDFAYLRGRATTLTNRRIMISRELRELKMTDKERKELQSKNNIPF